MSKINKEKTIEAIAEQYRLFQGPHGAPPVDPVSKKIVAQIDACIDIVQCMPEEATTHCVNLLGDNDRYVCGNCGTSFVIRNEDVRQTIKYCPICGYKFMEVHAL